MLKIDLDEHKKTKKKLPNQLIYHCSLFNEDAPTTVSLIWVGKLDVCMYVYKYIIV